MSSGQNFSGINYKTRIFNGMLIRGESCTLNITDNSAVAQSGGLPSGEVDGDLAADGELVVDTVTFKMITEAARDAGYFKNIPPCNLIFYANKNGIEQKIEAFGCVFKISALLNLDGKGGSKHTHTLPYYVTDPRFIEIDGVPYANPEEAAEVANYAN